MNILYFDCFSGISGDMMLGALLDLGIDEKKFLDELKKLKLDEYDIEIKKTERSGITGTDVSIILKHDHHHQHDHHHEHGHHHEHARNIKDIYRLIDNSELVQSVKDRAKNVFLELGKAEAAVHNRTLEDIHFHEVGAVDSIVDIVGTAICIDMLDIDEIYCSALHHGKGTIQCDHGKMPVPVPAVMKLLEGTSIPLIAENINTELITPTGMAFVKTAAQKFGDMPEIMVSSTGYGFGKKDTGAFNALRIVKGTISSSKKNTDEVVILEANIDDMSAEITGYVMDVLFQKNALDVFYTPIYMKKNRPGVIISVICSEAHEQDIIKTLFSETTTLGIRRNVMDRYIMDRETSEIQTPYGMVRVKTAAYGTIKKSFPEFEDCKRIAAETGKPIMQIYDEIKRNISD